MPRDCVPNSLRQRDFRCEPELSLGFGDSHHLIRQEELVLARSRQLAPEAAIQKAVGPVKGSIWKSGQPNGRELDPKLPRDSVDQAIHENRALAREIVDSSLDARRLATKPQPLNHVLHMTDVRMIGPRPDHAKS